VPVTRDALKVWLVQVLEEANLNYVSVASDLLAVWLSLTPRSVQGGSKYSLATIRDAANLCSSHGHVAADLL
jgi:hypothetical protein